MWRSLNRCPFPVCDFTKIYKLPSPKIPDFVAVSKRFLQDEVVYKSPFNMRSLRPFPGSRKKKKRKGRGVGSTKGRQCGRGSRAIASKRSDFSPQFEGGRPPFYAFYRFFPKKEVIEGEYFSCVDIGDLILYIKQGYFDPAKPITMFDLIDKRLIKDPRDGVKLLGKGYDLYDLKLHIEVSKATKGAIGCIERHGGIFKAVYVDPEILKCWANYKDVHHRIECAYDPVTKIPLETCLDKINPDVRKRMLQLQQLTGSLLPPSFPPPDKLSYYLSSANNGYLSKKVISKIFPSVETSNNNNGTEHNMAKQLSD